MTLDAAALARLRMKLAGPLDREDWTELMVQGSIADLLDLAERGLVADEQIARAREDGYVRGYQRERAAIVAILRRNNFAGWIPARVIDEINTAP